MPTNQNYVDQGAVNPFLDASTRGNLRLGEVGEQFLDPNSQIYQQFGQQLQERLNTASPTLNTLLGFQRASGVGGGAGTAIANEQRQAIEARNASAASSGQRDFFLQNQQQGAGLLGQSAQGFGNLSNTFQQQRQFNQSQTNLGEQFGQIGFGLAGSLLGGPAGGMLGGFLGNQLFGGGNNTAWGSANNPGTSKFNPQTGKVEFI